MLRLENIKIYEDLNEEEVLKKACKKYKIDINKVSSFVIYKKSIDARDKSNIFYNYTIDVEYVGNQNINGCKIVEKENFDLKIVNNRKSKLNPVIIGAGPAGLFAALTMVQNGLKPIVIEQGQNVQERKESVEKFLKTGKLNTNSNVQFGEGGAGAFSDGKLTTNSNNPLCRKVLYEFCRFGAPQQIMYVNKPHIGTDNLVNVIANMRNYIIQNGGKFIFNCKFIGFETVSNKLDSVQCLMNAENFENAKNIECFECEKNDDKVSFKIKTDAIILALGHSARDTFKMLYEKGLNMEKKNFSVGVRIEHKQSMINNSQYGTKSKLKLPPAEYKLAYHGKERSCYTFCMCPGGVVMASSSGQNEIVTNGMSTFARDGENANSAVLVNVVPEDFPGDNPLEGIEFQMKLEENAFKAGGSNYFAPVQRFEDFKNGKITTKACSIIPTYKPGIKFCDLNEILPEFVAKTLKEGITYFGKKIKGFDDNDAILTGVETRSSSPVRIIRNDENLMANINGIYPCGEGAGYAGGIMTAAVDGIKCAIKIIESN